MFAVAEGPAFGIPAAQSRPAEVLEQAEPGDHHHQEGEVTPVSNTNPPAIGRQIIVAETVRMPKASAAMTVATMPHHDSRSTRAAL